MRSALSRRVERLERELARRGACPACEGRGVPRIRCEGEDPPWLLPEDGPRGCRACGRVDEQKEIVVRFGPDPNGWWHAREDEEAKLRT